MKRRSLQMSPTPPRQKNSLNPHILRKSIEESRREMKKLKQQKSDMELKMVELRQTANNLEATTKKLIVQWAKACEMMVKVEEEDAAEPLVLPSAADDESKSAATLRVEDYSVELDNMDKRDQVYEVEAPNQHAIAIAQDFQVWLTQINALW
ncbi:uncharacterized protein LOC131012405 [Salvia miltiorrhiza]|uniref:uncharacterized protein LOC131012405 n=1 Tax=Salvia miltiorrhiza TaxID=226208 RepID=UPI0025AB9C3B|nr:uncharacterized protein LOC131012405 [Salvia miltiorrhiza]